MYFPLLEDDQHQRLQVCDSRASYDTRQYFVHPIPLIVTLETGFVNSTVTLKEHLKTISVISFFYFDLFYLWDKERGLVTFSRLTSHIVEVLAVSKS